MGITSELAAEARATRWDDLPPDVQQVARQCLLDWLGCTIAGSQEPLAAILRTEVAGADAAGQATLIGSGGRTGALTAALVNGAVGHALDFDDTHATMSGHPTVPVLPAALAVAERDGRSGTELLAALVAGIELECRLGALMAVPHYRVGWHATATFGTFGAAAAAAHLLDLDPQQWGCALGLAGSQAAGVKSNFGTMTKPFHAGRAAQSGLLAALLARGGYTANPDIVEVAQGFAAVAGGGKALDVGRLDAWKGRWAVRETLFKYHAACYLTHASINAVATLARDEPFDVAQVEAVEIRIEPGALDVCNIAEPRTGLEGKFSLRATAAMTLLGDDMADLATYSDRRVTDSAVVALRDRVQVVGDPAEPPMHATVALRLRDGGERRRSVDTNVPAEDLDWQEGLLQAKFVGLVRPVLGEAAATELVDRVATVTSASDLTDLIRLASAG